MLQIALIGMFFVGLGAFIYINNKITVLRNELKSLSETHQEIEVKTKRWISTTTEINVLLVMIAIIFGILFLFAYEGAI